MKTDVRVMGAWVGKGTGDSFCLAGTNGMFVVPGTAVPGILIACKAALMIFENELGAAGRDSMLRSDKGRQDARGGGRGAGGEERVSHDAAE